MFSDDVLNNIRILQGGFMVDLSKQEKLLLLLKQINFPEETINKYFTESYLERLDVYQQTKTWHFHIWGPKIVPAPIFHELNERLIQSFQSIATIKLTLSAADQTVNDGV